jgi:AbrB family looped-hinge helix DNA binding protein
MGSIVRVSRKHQVVVPREAREALGVGAGDELVVEVEKGKVMVKARPRNYARHMLGLHKDVWKGVKVEEYVRKEREAWGREASSRA